MSALDWAVFVLVVELVIILVPLTLVVVAWFRAHLPGEPIDPPPLPNNQPGITEPCTSRSGVLASWV